MTRTLLLIALVACSKRHEHHEIDHGRAHKLFDEIPIEAPPGMSGLAVDDRGVLWGIPERDRFLVEITLVGDKATTKQYPIEGVPDGNDTESIAWLGDHHFAIGIEGETEASAGIVFADLEGDKAIVKRLRTLTSSELGVELRINHGAEGACGHGNDVLVAIETVGTLADGARYAPIARLRDDALTIYPIRLTTQTGKLSALDCTIGADGTAHVWSIERHYGVCRVLKFDLPPTPREIVPTLEVDLGPVLNDTLNLEGIAQLPDGRIVIINDNQAEKVEGPTELLVFRPR